MGLFQRQKELKAQQAEIERSIEAAKKRVEEYLTMTPEEFRALPEDELYAAALARTEDIVKLYETPVEGVMALDYEPQVFYVTAIYEAELAAGGLCNFLCHSGALYATYISQCLEELGLDEHRDLYDSFIFRHNIDVNDLSGFECYDMRMYRLQTMRFPYAEFDAAYKSLPPIKTRLMEYMKENLAAFT